MATIKDIAKMAGVSHGTVSNVLNGRGNVSVKKIKLVEQAAQALGYQLNLQAKFLKQGTTKTISVLLPNITAEQYADLYDGLFSYLNRLGYGLTLYLTYDSKEFELQLIQEIAVKRDYAVIVVSALDSAQSYYQTLKIDKEKIIFVYRKPKSALKFISLDFEKAGHDIACEMIKNNYRHIGLFSNSDQHTHSQSFKKGLEQTFKQQNYRVEINCITSMPSNSTYNLSFNFFANEQVEYDAIITMDMERAHFVRNANYFGSLQSCPPIYTLTNHSFFYENHFYQYHMNYGILSRQIANLIEDQPVTLPENKGFTLLPDSLPHDKTNDGDTVNFLILPSPSTQAVVKLLPHFSKISGINVNLIVKPFDEIYHILNHIEHHQYLDIIRIDMAGLPWFAPSIFKPLSELQIDLSNIFTRYTPEIIDRFSYVNNIAYALPFDPSVQMLFYRKDLFDDPLIKRAYFEQFRQQLDVPANFADFNQISAFFNRQQNGESQVEFGSCFTSGNDELIASEFLVRYYAQGGKLFNQPQPQLDTAIALTTLTQLHSFIKLAKNINATWWQDSVKLFEQGKLAMLIVYMNLFSCINHRNILPLVGYAKVPGNKPLFGGGSLGVSKYSQKDAAIKSFFEWLYSPEISEQIALLGGATAQNSIFQNQRIINSYPWLTVAKQQYANGIRENSIKGKAVNLRCVENIIGNYLSKWMAKQYDSKQVIDLINDEIKKQYC
ncbi:MULTISPECIES: extracellular solute-binding protein [unclassified Gilliamella]|uniref:extracellular solute-binding protein n=1 Tax=unclassified Gilliamella TaxID=2685620 RepID=UPI002269976E|nr:MULTISPECIES: extracellular solute-binding protein [unclassified Gilliamella]MCX8641080.1 extracellular solute-binding protein [Gilliamella sp. B3835]MCX8707161.1 extracellular solute-binding protein [Gilliamella sp. B3783]MCX8710342.1 extracellular solute-binding protein [Gilliamella sp. B3780]MCX8715024.1 extracellular solute-binding protein [Gilliamella sp. B3781]MCX8716144.1 extracellular solute-binding protein [Gilliamella sp. B3784]